MTSSDLLRSLSGSVLPAGIDRLTGSGAAGAPSIEGGNFADLLAQAANGKLMTGRPVQVLPESGVTLNSDQTARMSAAIDQAEASGAQNALVMMDGMALKVNVATRQVVQQVDLSKAGVMSGIDTIVQAGGGLPGSAPKAPSVAGLPPSGFNPSLAKILDPSANDIAA
jgi:hypothetical protein